MQGSCAADGTAWAARIIEGPVPHSGGCTPMFSAGVKALPLTFTATTALPRIATARPTRRKLQRCSTIGSRGGARARNVPSRSRGSRFMNARSWVGLATPRVAANASDSSAGVK